MSKVDRKHQEYTNHLKASMEEILGVKFAESSIVVMRRGVMAYLILFLTGVVSLFLKFLQFIGVGDFSFIIRCISILGLISLILKSRGWQVTKNFISKYFHPFAVILLTSSISIVVAFYFLQPSLDSFISLAPFIWYEIFCVWNTNWKRLKTIASPITFSKVQDLEKFDEFAAHKIESLINLNVEIIRAVFCLITFLAFVIGGSLLVTLWMIVQIAPLLQKRS